MLGFFLLLWKPNSRMRSQKEFDLSFGEIKIIGCVKNISSKRPLFGIFFRGGGIFLFKRLYILADSSLDFVFINNM